jgi:hypothetical protein
MSTAISSKCVNMWQFLVLLAMMIVMMTTILQIFCVAKNTKNPPQEKELLSPPPANNKKIFCFWTEPNSMSLGRKSCLQDMMQMFGDRLHLVQGMEEIAKFEQPHHPFHPAYKYLSAVHKSDYLRVYFMYFYGGGYTDIKKHKLDTLNLWISAFDYLDTHPACWIVGYPEIGINGVPDSVPLVAKRHWQQLVGVSAFIARPGTLLLKEWLEEIESRLTEHFSDLKARPAQWPHDASGAFHTPLSTVPSSYPIPWSFLCADIFHMLQWKYLPHITQKLTPPDFHFYGYR